MPRKVKNSELEYIEECLVDLQVQIDNIKTYLDGNSWVDEQDEIKKKKEFSFQTKLFDNYSKWLEDFMRLTGIVDFYNEAQENKKDSLRKGFSKNHLMEKLKKGKDDNFEDIDEEE